MPLQTCYLTCELNRLCRTGFLLLLILITHSFILHKKVGGRDNSLCKVVCDWLLYSIGVPFVNACYVEGGKQ
jgi:hypothetical protein